MVMLTIATHKMVSQFNLFYFFVVHCDSEMFSFLFDE